MIDLHGRVAIVTGATRGIGRAIAEALVNAGASITVSARTPKDVDATAAALGKSAIGVTADVGRYEDCATLVARTIDHFGRLDILINNAGIGGFAPVAEMKPAQWRAVIDTNLSSLFYCSHEAIPHLRRQGGWIINIGSLAGSNAFPGGSAYNATKFGLIGFSEALMQEVRHEGIRVSYIMPGSVNTEFNGASARGGDWKIQPADIADTVLHVLSYPERTLPSRVEVRPTRPPKK